MRVGQKQVGGDGVAEGGDRFGQAAELQAGEAEIMLDGAVGGLESGGLAQGCDGVGGAPGFEELDGLGEDGGGGGRGCGRHGRSYPRRGAVVSAGIR